MAQMVTGTSAGKRKAPLIDLTPMVDLAFLLIAFFMLTTTLMENNAMILHMPIATPDPAPVNPDRLITILVGSNNTVWYYNGSELKDAEKTNYTNSGLRAVLYENKQRVFTRFGAEKGLICLIKLSDEANYQNMIDVLDEMEICDVATYAIQNITPAEKELLLDKK